MKKYHDSQLLPSQPMGEILLYCNTYYLQELLSELCLTDV